MLLQNRRRRIRQKIKIHDGKNKTSIKKRQMKDFHKNSCKIEDEVFILYMLDHELITVPNYMNFVGRDKQNVFFILCLN